MAFAVPAAKRAVLDAFAERDGLSQLAVMRGAPKQLPKPLATGNEDLYLLGTSRGAREEGRLRVESYDLRLLVEVHGLADQAAVEARLWAIWDEMDEALREDPGLPGPFEALLVLTDEESGHPGGRWLARGEGYVRVRAVT